MYLYILESADYLLKILIVKIDNMLLSNSLKMKSKLKKKQTFLYKLLNSHFGIFLVIQEKRKIT